MTDDVAQSGEPILIVDDEKNIRRTVRMVLEGEGHVVHEAGSIAEAEGVLGREAVDVILLDVKLGEDNGLDLLRSLKTRGEDGSARLSEIPVVMISGHATIEDAVAATRLGAFDFMEKPLDRNRVIAARDRLKAVMARGDVSPAELNQVERDIHIDIVHACPNVQMVRIIRDSQRSLITTMHTFERYGSTPKMVLAFEEHLAVLEAIVAGDPDGAADALRQHLIRAQASTVPRMIDLPPLDKDRYPPYLLPVESA